MNRYRRQPQAIAPPVPHLIRAAAQPLSPWLLVGAGAGGAVVLMLLAIGMWHGAKWLPSVGPAKVTAVTYVHQKGSADAPPPVLAALNKLNQRGILATQFEIDATDGDEEVPDQYKVAAGAAKEHGVPCAVAQAGVKVVRVVKNPRTEAHIEEVAK